MYDLIIIGAGAAGLFAGAYAGLNFSNKKIMILEKNSKPASKLMISGNGQCNFTHEGSPEDFIKHYGDKGKSIKHVLYDFDYQKLVSWMNQINIPALVREDGKVFPESLKAEEIRDAFLKIIDQAKIELKLSQNITQILPENEAFYIVTTRTRYQTKRILWCTGGKSWLLTGNNWNSYDLLESIDIQINPMKPALCPPLIKNFHYASLMGISFKNIPMTLKKADHKKKQFRGDMLFTHFGVSGPLILDASRYYEPGDKLIFNFSPFLKFDDFQKDFVMLIKRNPRKIIKNLLAYYPIPAALVLLIMQDLDIQNNQDVYGISNLKLDKLLHAIFAFELEIENIGSFNMAMATNGGVSLKQVNSKTMESKIHKGLYFAGEVLDVDGDTGGYNIHFAFASAKVAVEQMFKA